MLLRTPLFAEHQSLSAKIVEFGGWQMPLSYSSILKEHQAVRSQAGLFDVSHMGEIFVEGEDALSFLQFLTCNDVGRLKPGKCQYNLLLNEQAGVVDDLLIYQLEEKNFLLCVNAANIEKDFQWLQSHQQGHKVAIENRSEQYGLLALQGPLSETILQPLTDALLGHLPGFHCIKTKIVGIPVLVSRTGYTGEDGFEIFASSSDLVPLWGGLLEAGGSQLLPCGLGCRDTLRLEMAYPLYGHELTETISPLEANLGWVVDLKKPHFLGRARLVAQQEQGLSKKRVGFVVQGKGIARADYPLIARGEKVGWVSSGTYSPSLDKAIGCGYLPPSLSEIGSEVEVEIRDKRVQAKIVKTPFYSKKS